MSVRFPALKRTYAGYPTPMQSVHKTALVWFRRGVRVRDNHALTGAVKSAETVVPVFILDPTILRHPTTAPVRARFLFESLRSLDDELRKIGGRLILRHGKPLEELEPRPRNRRDRAVFRAGVRTLRA